MFQNLPKKENKKNDLEHSVFKDYKSTCTFKLKFDTFCAHLKFLKITTQFKSPDCHKKNRI